MDFEREKELSTGEIPQLATCTQRGPNDVRNVQNGQNGAFHERFGDARPPSGVLMPRSRPPRHEQRFPNEDRITAGDPLFNKYNGTPPFRSMCYDFEYRQQ